MMLLEEASSAQLSCEHESLVNLEGLKVIR